jgi:hypothetical protein
VAGPKVATIFVRRCGIAATVSQELAERRIRGTRPVRYQTTVRKDSHQVRSVAGYSTHR